MAIRITFLAIAISIYLLGCSTDKTEGEKATTTTTMTMAPTSELTTHMRALHANMERIKVQLKKGEKPELFVELEAIHSAKATESEKTNDPDFKTLAVAYEEAIKTFLEASTNQKVAYTAIVNSCISCHQQFCPGPVRKIKKLHL